MTIVTRSLKAWYCTKCGHYIYAPERVAFLDGRPHCLRCAKGER